MVYASSCYQAKVVETSAPESKKSSSCKQVLQLYISRRVDASNEAQRNED